MTNLDAWNIERVLPSAIADLHKLISIPSISSMPEHDGDVTACRDTVAGLFRDLGAAEVKFLDGGGKPAVWAHFPGPEGTLPGPRRLSSRRNVTAGCRPGARLMTRAASPSTWRRCASSTANRPSG